MEFVQVVVTDEQVTKAKYAIDVLLDDPERFVMEDEERQEFERLSVFLTLVAENPKKFPVYGPMAKKVRSIVRAAKGPAETPSRRNKRKARQERRQSFSKRRRKERAETARAFNEAQMVIEAERKEAEEAARELEEKLAKEPKFDVLDMAGNVLLAGVPASMVRAVDEEDAPLTDEDLAQAESDMPEKVAPKVILPGTAEALGIETP